MGAVNEVIDTATDIVSDAGSTVDDFVNDEIPGGWGTVAVIASPTLAGMAGVPASYIPYVAPATSAAVTLDQGGDLGQALLNAGLTYGAQELARSASDSMSGLNNLDEIQYEPIDDVVSAGEQTVKIHAGSVYGSGGPGYYDEITGEWISNPNGALPGPLNPDISGNPATMAGWSVNPTAGTWTSPEGEVFQSTPWNPNATGMSGEDIMRNAGALPGSGTNGSSGLGLRDLASIATIAGVANAVLNPPELPQIGSGGTGGFNIVPVPSDWKSPTYNQQFTPLDLNSLFTTANLLKGTQWENLPPEIKFAAAPTIEALTNMISNGQTTTGR